ncbi:MAG: hypothetical protein NVSMB17_03300 [Candidatus Dormibacteria bacterium]
MGFVVIRRFRSGGADQPATSRAFKREEDARVAARAWADEGWEVEFLASARRVKRTVRVESPSPMPPRPLRP